MPSAETILAQLRTIAVQWKSLAILFHVYFGILAAALVAGIRPSRRSAGRLLALPFVAVSAVAWVEGNPFNGAVFAVLWILLLVLAGRLPTDRLRLAPPALLVPGIALFLFGWAYPHFLEGEPAWVYLYRAPTGLIPCPTLSIVIGLTLVADGFRSRAFGLTLGLAGLLYGAIGVFRLGVTIDAVLLAGAVLMLAVAFRKPPAL
jgi:hypothetical protein